jgi:hypothetical protein
VTDDHDDLQPFERVQVFGAVGPSAPPDGTVGRVLSKLDDGRYVVEFENPDPPAAPGWEVPRAHLRRLAEDPPHMVWTRSSLMVWDELNALTHDGAFPAPPPVKTIAVKLGLNPAYVAAVVYFDVWSGGQEPDLPPGLRVVD